MIDERTRAALASGKIRPGTLPRSTLLAIREGAVSLDDRPMIRDVDLALKGDREAHGRVVRAIAGTPRRGNPETADLVEYDRRATAFARGLAEAFESVGASYMIAYGLRAPAVGEGAGILLMTADEMISSRGQYVLPFRYEMIVHGRGSIPDAFDLGDRLLKETGLGEFLSYDGWETGCLGVGCTQPDHPYEWSSNFWYEIDDAPRRWMTEEGPIQDYMFGPRVASADVRERYAIVPAPSDPLPREHQLARDANPRSQPMMVNKETMARIIASSPEGIPVGELASRLGLDVERSAEAEDAFMGVLAYLSCRKEIELVNRLTPDGEDYLDADTLVRPKRKLKANPEKSLPYKLVMRDMEGKWRAIPKRRGLEILQSPGTFDGGSIPEHQGHQVAVLGVMTKARKVREADYSVPVWDYNVGRLDTRAVLERLYRDEALRETKSRAYRDDHAIVHSLEADLDRLGARAANPESIPGAPAYAGAAVIAAEAERGRIVWHDASCRDALVTSIVASQAEGGVPKVLTSYASPDGETWVEHHSIVVVAATAEERAPNPPPGGPSHGYEAAWGVYHPEGDEEFYDDINQATGRALALSSSFGVPVRVRMYAGDSRGGWLWGAMLEVTAREVPYQVPAGERRMTQRDFDRAVGRSANPAELEGPFRFPTGRVLYYDRREGRYYDKGTDLYLDDEEAAIATGLMRPRGVDIAAIKHRVMK